MYSLLSCVCPRSELEVRNFQTSFSIVGVAEVVQCLTIFKIVIKKSDTTPTKNYFNKICYSMGDMHFSQGDGEVSFCGAIEMAGYLDLKCTVIKGGMKILPAVGPSPLNVNPIFEIGPLEPRFSEWLVFEGISVDEQGKQHYLDATIAYKRAVLNCIKYLAQFGFSEEQVYLLLSCCPCEGRISGIVDVPNAVATLAVPLAIFDRDVRPPSKIEALANGVYVVDKNCCISVEGGAVPYDPRLDA